MFTTAVAKGVTNIVIGSVSMPLFRKAHDFIKQKWEDYDERNMNEIQAVQKYYKEQCYPVEKDHKPTTLGIVIANQPDQISSSELPIYLQMDTTRPKIPVLFAKDFCPNLIVADWTRLLGKNTHLRHSIEEMLSYICQYQQDRDKRWFGKGYNYDPTNLFFEEFKSWLVELSKSPLNLETLEVVKARKLYLIKLYVNQVFKQGQNKPTRADVVQKLLKLLETNLIPTIELALSRTSAREHFDLLKSNVENLIKNTTSFLFYLFRDTEEVPLTFILDQLRNPTLINSYKMSLDNLSGQLLKQLANSEPFIGVFPRLELDTQLAEYNYQSIVKNDFVRLDGAILFPLEKNNIHRYNWFNDEVTKTKSGILAAFRQQELMDNFLKLHGLLQKACAFYVICDLLYELAGDGGNLMVYGLAARKVLDAIKVFSDLMNQIEKVTGNLYQHARDYFDHLINISSTLKLSQKDDNWKARFHFTDEFYSNNMKRIEDCKKITVNINSAIAQVQDLKYIRSVKSRIALFYQLVEDFSNEALLQDNQTYIVSNINPFEANHSKEEKAITLSNDENDYGEHYISGMQEYKQRNYQEACAKFITACELKPENMVAKLYLAHSLAGCGCLEPAIQMIQSVISELSEKQQRNNPLYQDALYARSVFYKSSGLQQAEAGLEELLDINPDHKLAKDEKIRIKKIQAENQEVGYT